MTLIGAHACLTAIVVGSAVVQLVLQHLFGWPASVAPSCLASHVAGCGAASVVVPGHLDADRGTCSLHLWLTPTVLVPASMQACQNAAVSCCLQSCFSSAVVCKLWHAQTSTSGL